MRTLFDQYQSPENRLTHALVCCLDEEPALLRRFVAWATDTLPPRKGIEIVEQQLPGEESEITEDEAEQRGLPDAWIHDGGTWALLIENKVSSPVRFKQLRRHRITAERRGFKQILLLVISVDGARPKAVEGTYFLKWTDVYKWVYKETRNSDWAERLVAYMEVAEARMIADGYLKKGTLTVFSGIPFNEKNPYNYLEAKRVLGLLIEELRSRKDLQNKLGVDLGRKGRPAITGKEGSAVWDFLWLRKAKDERRFEKFPHLALEIHREHAGAMISLPNGMESSFRRNLVGLSGKEFTRLIRDIESRWSKAVRKKGAIPWMYVTQRHFPSRKALSVMDGRINFDIRTALTGKKRNKKIPVKVQQEWVESAYRLIVKKRGNVQAGVGAIFPYGECKKIGTPGAIDLFVNTWIACKPLLDAVLKIDKKGTRVKKAVR